MRVIEKTYSWSKPLSKRPSTAYIVLHHAAMNGSADDIHRVHTGNGYSGIGYQFYVRKDGSIYRGRPIDKVGAHALGVNQNSIGICFEGNFEKEPMSDAQIKAGQWIVGEVKRLYSKAKVVRHKEVCATACPGKNFPFDEIVNGTMMLESTNDIVWELNHRGIMTDKQLWLKKCVPDSNAYWLAYKIANLTKNSAERKNKLETVNDIVWELNQRGIITDKPLWLKLLNEDKDLYWLAYKAANMTVNK